LGQAQEYAGLHTAVKRERQNISIESRESLNLADIQSVEVVAADGGVQ